MVMWREIWISLISFNFTPFYPIQMGFSVEILLFCYKEACIILNTAFQIFNVVTKNSCHLWRHTFKKSPKYIYVSKY